MKKTGEAKRKNPRINYAKIREDRRAYWDAQEKREHERAEEKHQAIMESLTILRTRFVEMMDTFGNKPTPEQVAESARQSKIRDARKALASKRWADSGEKAKHGPDCEWDACVCERYFASVGLAQALHFPGAQTQMRFGTPLAQPYDSDEVRS